MESPKATVVIPHRNRRELLLRCLDSLRAQSVPWFEVLVVDNGSGDGSVEVVRERDPAVRVLLLGRNTGYAHASNRGIAEARTDLVILLNNDVECDPEFVRELVRGMEEYPDAAWGASQTLRMEDRERIDSCGLDFSFVGIARKRWAGLPRDRKTSGCPAIDGATGNGTILRKSAFAGIGLFDERYFAYCEDMDLAYRARNAGLPCIYIPRAVCYHAESATLGRNSPETIYYFQRNMELVFAGNPSLRYRLVHYVPNRLYSLYCLVRWIGRGRGRIVLQAKRDAGRMLRGKEPLHDPRPGGQV